MQQTLDLHARHTLIRQMATLRRALAAVEDRCDFTTALQLIDAAFALDPRSQLGRCLGRISASVARKKVDAARRTHVVRPREFVCVASE
jgi:hypothetical protein